MKLTASLFTITLLLLFTVPIVAQEKWDLKKCVEYAWQNNYNIKQADNQAGIDALTLKQAKLAQYPTANGSANTGLQFGRSIDPTTNQFTTTELLFQQYNLQTSVTIFNWNFIKNNIIANQYAAEASKMDVEKQKNDIGLNVATNFLQALLAKEQVNIAEAQLQLTKNQLIDTRKRVDAGALPELNAVQLEAQLATDSSSLIAARANAEQNLLTLKALLYLDAALPFDITAPSVDIIPVDPIAELQPDYVFQMAMKNQPAQKSNDLRYKSFEAMVKVSKSQLYPTLSAFGGLGTRFSNPSKSITGASFLGYNPADPFGAVVDVSGTQYPVLTPNFKYIQSSKSFGQMWNGWGNQLSNNFSQNIGITLNIPIFNSGSARINYEKAKLNLKNVKLLREQIDQTLKQNIYQAYNSSLAALQKYNANQSTVVATQKAFDFATKRYNLGLLSTFELITSQTNLEKAKFDLVNSHYDFVFKMKVLEYYKGQGLRLQ
jgi:outer membrane protein